MTASTMAGAIVQAISSFLVAVNLLWVSLTALSSEFDDAIYQKALYGDEDEGGGPEDDVEEGKLLSRDLAHGVES